MYITNVWLESKQYDELLSEVFGYSEITNCVYVGDQPAEFVERLLVAMDFIDPFGYSLECDSTS